MDTQNNEILKKIIGQTSINSYMHPLFRDADTHAKLWARFIPKSALQPDNTNEMLNIAASPTKIPTNYSLGANAQERNG